MLIHQAHLVTSVAYVLVGALLAANAYSFRCRWAMAKDENERAFNFGIVAVFVYACALDHAAESLGADTLTLMITAVFEAIVSAGTAVILGIRTASRW